ncbi:MAG: pyridoxal-dependent decarboxylase [Flavipsychrobacter sp.]|nr:pyridoxal-dependent decarboxylase [Flavipsychrobacter sp.]
MKYWKKLSHKEQDKIITAALDKNINYKDFTPLGIPVSKLDPNVFYEHASFLNEAPLLRTYIQNPNHIGCHTLGESEPFFEGTQQLEREIIELLSVDVFKANINSCDGYIAAGGTEANIQAAWIYRNYFQKEFEAEINEIALLSSSDTHYSVTKAANLLNIQSVTVDVDENTRAISVASLDNKIEEAKRIGIKYFIVFANMATTMFGSVDDPDLYAERLTIARVHYKLHIDGAFGGFIYPISYPENNLNFANEHVSSITLDAHKMLQAPFGTGIFIAKKGLMQFVYTKEAQYVNGMDITLSGSRSGANAVAVWMILFTYGPHGWFEKINKLLYRTQWLCGKLEVYGFAFYRHPNLNIVTIKASHIPADLAKKYGLVPDTHNSPPNWYKIVVMDHVEVDYLQLFLNDLRERANSYFQDSTPVSRVP